MESRRAAYPSTSGRTEKRTSLTPQMRLTKSGSSRRAGPSCPITSVLVAPSTARFRWTRLALRALSRLAGGHDPDLGPRPGKDDVGTELALVHRYHCASVGLAQHDGELWDRGAGKSAQKARTAADHAVPLLAHAGHEARRVDEDDQ